MIIFPNYERLKEIAALAIDAQAIQQQGNFLFQNPDPNHPDYAQIKSLLLKQYSDLVSKLKNIKSMIK